MSQPLLFVSPDDGKVYEVKETEEVTLESIDDQIAHHQNRVSELNVKRQKFLDLSAEEAAEDAAETASATASGTSAPVSQPAEATPPAPAPADNTANAPAGQTAPASTDTSSADQAATPPISA